MSTIKLVLLNIAFLVATAIMPSVIARAMYHFVPNNELRFIINWLPVAPYYYIPIFALIYYANFKLASTNIEHRKVKIVCWVSLAAMLWYLFCPILSFINHFHIGGHK